MNQKLTITLFFLATLACLKAEDCQQQNYIIPYEALDTVFDGGIDAVRSQENLIALIQNPNSQTLMDYILSLVPYSAPLFTMAGITFVVFIASIVQVICFNTCGKQCCGNEINSSTYNICCMRTMTIFFIFFSFLAMCLCIAALIVNSDLQKAIDYTSCNTINIINQTYEGNDNVTIPWSGINNFNSDIILFGKNIVNVVPLLSDYFDPLNDAYQEVTDTTTVNSLYNLSQLYICQNSSETILCPFSSDVGNCSAPYQPLFNVEFCDPQVQTSSQKLITDQKFRNSTTWKDNIIQMRTSLSNINTQQSQVDNLVTEITNFTNSVSGYEGDFQNGFQDAQQINYNLEIAFYVFYSFLLLCALVSITTVCCTFYCNNFACKCWTYVFWWTFFIFSLVLFILAGLFLTGSILTYDACSAYPYYFNNETNFKTLKFDDAQIQGIFQNCFYEKEKSIFSAFNDTTILNQFGELRNEYIAASPASIFSTVVTQIQNRLYNYSLNTDTVIIDNVDEEQQPAQALRIMNLFANSSNPDTTQSCQYTETKVVFNPSQCSPYLITSEYDNNSCFVLLSAYNFTDRQGDIVTNFQNRACFSEAARWQQQTQALLDYRNSIGRMVLELAPVKSESGNLQDYQTNYFNYYAAVRNFFNSGVQASFNSFFDPYVSLQEGSSCGFVTASMDGIINVACNQLFPYFNALSVLNIIISVLVFLMMILSYFLTVRYQFYEFLEGNFENYGVETYKINELPGYSIDSNRNNNNVELMTNGVTPY